MKNLFVLLAVLFCGLSSCEKSTQPEEPEIVEVKAEKFELNVQLLSAPPFESNCIIHSMDELQKLTKNPPDINFSKYTLLGAEFYSDTRCPAPPVYPKIIKNNRTKTYTYPIEYGMRGPCTQSWGHTFWYLIPKIDSAYTVEFVRTYIGGKYDFDSLEIANNLKLWLSNTKYGIAKTVFKKGEPIYVNYSFKNYTQKPLDWFQNVDGEFGHIYMDGPKNTTYSYPDYGGSRDTLMWGTLKTGETIANSWKVHDLIPGLWRVEGVTVRNFKFILLDNRIFNFTVEE